MAFQEVEESYYPNILKFLETRLPKSAMAYNATKITASKCLPPSCGSKIYRYVNEIDSGKEGPAHSEFIVLVEYRKIYNTYAVIISSPENPTEDMKAAFENLLDWSLPILFCAVDTQFSSSVKEMTARRGQLNHVDLCQFMTVDLDSSPSKFDVSLQGIQRHFPNATIEVKELSPSDAKLVAKKWNHAREGTAKYLETAIRHVGSSGVFINGELVSWVVIYVSGSIHALYTEEPLRGKGIAMLTMQKICQIALKHCWMPNVQVSEGNSASHSLMEKVGFKTSHFVEWVGYDPL